MNLIRVNHENMLPGANEVHVVHTPSEIGLSEEEIRTKYADVFQGLGELGGPLHLEVNEMITPVQIPPRRIPEALKVPLKDHLAELEQQGVIEKVTQATDWVSAIVVNKKSNGKIRLCLDPQPLNRALKRYHYPIPTIEEVLPDLQAVSKRLRHSVEISPLRPKTVFSDQKRSCNAPPPPFPHAMLIPFSFNARSR